jgi:hypothetical protein
MNKKTLFAFIGIVALALVAYLIFTTSTTEAPTAPNTNNTEVVSAGPITVVGEITCLPKVGTGEQTMECGLGLETEDGVYYGLRNNTGEDVGADLMTTGIEVLVSGELILEEIFGPDGNRYDTVGVIEVESVQRVVN